MEHPIKRSRARKLIAGAVLGSIVSIGAISGSASAAKTVEPAETTELSVVVKLEPIVLSLRSGIRW